MAASGAAVAEVLADRGGSVALVDRDSAGIDAVRARLIAAGASPERLRSVAADVTDEDHVLASACQVERDLGRIGILFTHAGIAGEPRANHADELAELEAVRRVNVTGVFLRMKHVVAAMRRSGRRGSVINAASGSALVGSAGMPAYTASKVPSSA